MRKSLGAKRKEITDDQIAEITRLYHDAMDTPINEQRVKVFDNAGFGYHRITVERPLRRRWAMTEEAIATITNSRPFLALANPPKGATDPAAAVHEGEQAQQRLIEVLNGLTDCSEELEAAFDERLSHRLVDSGLTIPSNLRKAILSAAAQPDPDAPAITNRKGLPLPDPDLRDNENVPLTEPIGAYVSREILPHVPDAWVDQAKTKIGYEIPFTRHFYTYTPSRPVAEIDTEIESVEAEIQRVLRGIAR